MSEYTELVFLDMACEGENDPGYYEAYAEYFGGVDFDVRDADDALMATQVYDLYEWYLYDNMMHMDVMVEHETLSFESIDVMMTALGLRIEVDEIAVDQEYVLVNGFVISTR